MQGKSLNCRRPCWDTSGTGYSLVNFAQQAGRRPRDEAGKTSSWFFFFQFWSLQCICYNIASVLSFGFFAFQGRWDFSSPTRDLTAPPALEGKVLTTGLTDREVLRAFFFLILIFIYWHTNSFIVTPGLQSVLQAPEQVGWVVAERRLSCFVTCGI